MASLGPNALTHYSIAKLYGDRSRSTLAQVMTYCLTVPSHYLNQCWLLISEVLWHSPKSKWVSKLLFCIMSLKIILLKLLPQLPEVNDLTHCGLVTPYNNRSESTWAQVMACCLMAASHYPNQCWLVISEVQWQSPEGNFTKVTSAINHHD